MVPSRDIQVTQTLFYMAQLLKALSSGFGGSGGTHSPRRECVCEWVCVSVCVSVCVCSPSARIAKVPVLQRCSYSWKWISCLTSDTWIWKHWLYQAGISSFQITNEILLCIINLGGFYGPFSELLWFGGFMLSPFQFEITTNHKLRCEGTVKLMVNGPVWDEWTT